MSLHCIYSITYGLKCHVGSCRCHGIEQHQSNMPCSVVIVNKECDGTLHNFVFIVLNLISKLIMDLLIIPLVKTQQIWATTQHQLMLIIREIDLHHAMRSPWNSMISRDKNLINLLENSYLWGNSKEMCLSKKPFSQIQFSLESHRKLRYLLRDTIFHKFVIILQSTIYQKYYFDQIIYRVVCRKCSKEFQWWFKSESSSVG